MFSQTFPSYHPKAGQPTYFVEKIWKYLSESNVKTSSDSSQNFPDEVILKTGELIDPDTFFPKSHTIRAGNRWRENVFFSPRIWSGPPYRSKQILIAEEMQIKKTWNILILPSQEVFINGEIFGFYGSPEIEKLAHNDGLSGDEFQNWFSHLPFEGQIICWNPDLEY